MKTKWIISTSTKDFDIISAIDEFGTIWSTASSLTTKIKVDDIVYLYIDEPYSKIMYKFVCSDVVKQGYINPNEKDLKYYRNPEKCIAGVYNCFKLEKLQYIDDDNLSLEKLNRLEMLNDHMFEALISDFHPELFEYVEKQFLNCSPEENEKKSTEIINKIVTKKNDYEPQQSLLTEKNTSNKSDLKHKMKSKLLLILLIFLLPFIFKQSTKLYNRTNLRYAIEYINEDLKHDAEIAILTNSDYKRADINVNSEIGLNNRHGYYEWVITKDVVVYVDSKFDELTKEEKLSKLSDWYYEVYTMIDNQISNEFPDYYNCKDYEHMKKKYFNHLVFFNTNMTFRVRTIKNCYLYGPVWSDGYNMNGKDIWVH